MNNLWNIYVKVSKNYSKGLYSHIEFSNIQKQIFTDMLKRGKLKV